jgi:hypothetical protein
MMSVNEKPWPKPPHRHRPAERVAAQVVDLALLGVRQHLVRSRDGLEPLLRLRVGVDVRVQLACQSAVRLLDVVRGRVAIDAENPVVVLAHACLFRVGVVVRYAVLSRRPGAG